MATAKRLTDMVIDEVSFVDRAANQHSTVAFAKNDAGVLEEEMPVLEDTVELYDVDGDAVDPSLLEHGDVVYASDGTELVYVVDGEEVASPDGFNEYGDFEGDYEAEAEAEDTGFDESEDVGKSTLGVFARGVRGGVGGAKSPLSETLNPASQKGFKVGQHALKHKKKYAIGAGTAGAAGVGGAAYGMSKSLGEQVLEELSKAASNDEREAIIAKAMDEVEIAKAAAAEAWEQVEAERDARLTMEFISKAEDYNLPIAPTDFGPILKRLVERMEPEDIEVLDQIFKAAGDMLYDEVGFVGGGDNASVLDMVNAAADEMVGKADVTNAEAFTAMLDANPDLYDAYLAEQGR